MNKPIYNKYNDGVIEYRLDGSLHREDGPAYTESNGYQGWWINGKRHRLDGPARIDTKGLQEWWIEGQRYLRQEYFMKLLDLGYDQAYIFEIALLYPST